MRRYRVDGDRGRRAVSKVLVSVLAVAVASTIIGVYLVTRDGGESGPEEIGDVQAREAIPTRPPKEFFVKAISKTEFRPEIIQIRVGDTVTWENVDSVPHTVTSSNITSTNEIVFNRLLVGEEKFSYTFTEPGTYFYSCTIKYHGMSGIIRVQR